MKITIGRFDPATGTVPVTFADGAHRHRRAVNAMMNAAGKYDRAATRAQVAEVAAGVANKFALGLLGMPIIEDSE